jgi:BirA family transcriptional regulator, biotin operon repressor / biotin---[acetyl-CoA-carboxylase] ligase
VDALLGAPAARLKWPNDVLLDDRKLAGIVCEGRWQGDRLQWLALGVGVNVCNPAPAAVARTAISLNERLPGARRMDLLDRLVPALTRIAADGRVLSERECAAFEARDWLRGRRIRSPAPGRARGVRPDGALLVDRDAVGAGEVEMAGVETIVLRQGHVELA